MARVRRIVVAGGLAVAAVASGLAIVALRGDKVPLAAAGASTPPGAVPLAVLGDSTSHSYQDEVAFREGSADRGGAFRARTFNWLEVLVRLRGKEIDAGPWVTWGTSGAVAAAREALGLAAARAPRKEDYLYNFANSGAVCANLTEGRFRQAPRLLELMRRDPERWKRGVVVIRIGINDWASQLEVLSKDPHAPAVLDVTRRCVAHIGRTVESIHAQHPDTRVLVVGIVNEADDPAYADRFDSARESANIDRALMAFNGALRRIAQGTKNVAYFDDAAWMVRRWGRRDADGRPDYKIVVLGNSLRISNTAGDDPHDSVLADHHAGLAWNALWAQSLVLRLRDAFKLPLTPITDQEVADFVLPLAQPAN